MEEQALYRAILVAPHDDTPRLVYADWLDENADQFPQPRAEHARAEFIRLQCADARRRTAEWESGRPQYPPSDGREKRLLFTSGPKWRRALPVWLASSPFDRGFLRPYRALRPEQFLSARRSGLGEQAFFGPLPPDHPARRFLGEDGYFSLCPLWDVHLYAPDYSGDLVWSDRGQYTERLAEVGRNPALERVGWLKVSFLHTPTAEFLRTGNFPNVETLVLNCGPFPEVLEAVAANESFRSLHYVWFGSDRWAWAPTMPMPQFASLVVRLDEANRRNLPYGEMREALRAIAAQAALPPTPSPSDWPRPRLPLQDSDPPRSRR